MASEILARISAMNDALVEALRTGAIDDIAAMCTDAMIILPPGSPPVQGEEALGNFWRRLQNWRLELVVSDVHPVGTSALREVGDITMTRVDSPARPFRNGPGQATGPMHGRYLVVWESIGDGWKRDSFMWNRAVPAAKAAPDRRVEGAAGSPNRPTYVPRAR